MSLPVVRSTETLLRQLLTLLPVHTDQYQAMYRVLNAFALLNAILCKTFLVSRRSPPYSS